MARSKKPVGPTAQISSVRLAGMTLHLKNAGFNNNRRMGDLKFDPKTGIDLVKFEKEALAKRARKVVKQALKRREEALVGRGH